MYLMSSKYSEYLYLYLYLQIWKSTCTWLKYFEKYLTPTLDFSNQNAEVFFRRKKKKTFENVVRKVAEILFRP